MFPFLMTVGAILVLALILHLATRDKVERNLQFAKQEPDFREFQKDRRALDQWLEERCDRKLTADEMKKLVELEDQTSGAHMIYQFAEKPVATYYLNERIRKHQGRDVQ
jgi:hypothetical protein